MNWLKPIKKNIPDELKQYPQWVCWKAEKRGDKWTKVPYDPKTGRNAKADDPGTWGDFETAWKAYQSGEYTGVGFELAADDPFCGWDLDHCLEPGGAIESWATEIIGSLESYAEVSPSGTGLRSIVKAGLPPDGRKKGDVEVYQEGRFLTITGHLFQPFGGKAKPIEPRQNAVDALHAKIFGNGYKPGSNQKKASDPPQDDAEILEKAFASKNGDKIRALYNGDTAGYNSQSEADSALCYYLAFWLDRDPQRIDAVFRQSGLYRPKWDKKHKSDGRTYGQLTIDNAISDTSETYHQGRSDGGQSAGIDPNDPPDPLPLTRESVSAEPYPVDALGPIIGPAAKKIMDVVQAPDAVCVHSVLAAATLCVQPFANIKIDGRRFPILEYFISICSTGGRKSEADKTATAEIRQWEEEQLREYHRAYKAYSDAHEAYENQKKKITGNKKLTLDEQSQQLATLRKSEPERPFNPVRLTTDPTFEGLVKLFERSLPTLGLFADEGGLFSGGFSMTSEKQLYSAAGYSKFWDGARIDRIRAGSESFSLYDRRLTVHLMMQDQVAGDFFNNPVLQDQGLLSRFLVAFPAPTVGTRIYKEENLQESEEMKRFHSRVSELLSRDLPLKVDKKTGQVLNELEPADLELTTEAKRYWIEFYQAVEFNSGKDGTFENIPGFANKAPEHCLRIAGVLTLFDNPKARVIDLDHVEAATTLVEYYLNERIRVRGMAQPDQQLLRAQELLKWLKDKGLKRVCLPDVYQYGPNKLRTAQQARDTVNVLVNHYYLIHKEGKHKSEIDGKTARESWIIR